MNNIIIHGRLTRDPELKDFTNGRGEPGKMCKFAVAVNRRFGDETDFFDCTLFGKSGEALEKYFHKGDGIVVSGEMQSNKGRKEETKKITYWTVLVREWDFAEKRGDGKADPNTRAELEDAGVQEDFKQIDEDVPF